MPFRSTICLLALLLAAPLTAAEPSGGKSLDDQLLEDLSTDEPKAQSPAQAKPQGEPRAPEQEPAGLDQQLLDEIDGEDIGMGPEPDPLTRIGRNMRKSETLIEKRDTSKKTQDVQKRILADLDEMLRLTKQQCQGGQSKPSSSTSKPSSKNNPNSQASSGEPSSQPARDSSDRLSKAGKTDVEDEQDLDALVKQVWGHLPDKVRGQMQNVSVEDFLPKYEKLIEEYYKRLAEEP